MFLNRMRRFFARTVFFLRHRSINLKFALVLIICLILMMMGIMKYHITNQENDKESSQQASQNQLRVILQSVVVHIDLKGAPPLLDYLLSLLKVLKKFGVNGLLIEYEDMFPYEGRLITLRAPNCYKKEKLKNFLTKATESGFEIIPMVPTFGHMEFVLEKFQHLCEVPYFCDVICPQHNDTLPLIEDILGQIIKFHNSIIPLKHIHIGFDKVYDIKQCNTCYMRLISKTNVVLTHLKAVTKIVKKLNYNTKVLFWDDMVRNFHKEEWKYIDVDKNIEPVYWDFRNNFTVSHNSIDNYQKRFGNIWIGSAFKGFDGRTAIFPILKDRFENHLNWMNQVLDYKFGGNIKVFHFKGIILTGRSRYSHFAPPCELLPASMPSLIINLLLIQRFKEGIPYKISDWLEFYYKYLKYKLDEVFACNICLEKNDLSKCLFEAKKLYHTIRKAEKMNTKFLTKYLYELPWILTPDKYFEYNRLNKRFTTHLLDKYIRFGRELLLMEIRLEKIMKVYFDDKVVQEYVGYTYHNIKRKVTKAFNTFCIFLNTILKNATEIYLDNFENVNNTVCITGVIELHNFRFLYGNKGN